MSLRWSYCHECTHGGFEGFKEQGKVHGSCEIVSKRLGVRHEVKFYIKMKVENFVQCGGKLMLHNSKKKGGPVYSHIRGNGVFVMGPRG